MNEIENLSFYVFSFAVSHVSDDDDYIDSIQIIENLQKRLAESESGEARAQLEIQRREAGQHVTKDELNLVLEENTTLMQFHDQAKWRFERQAGSRRQITEHLNALNELWVSTEAEWEKEGEWYGEDDAGVELVDATDAEDAEMAGDVSEADVRSEIDVTESEIEVTESNFEAEEFQPKPKLPKLEGGNNDCTEREMVGRNLLFTCEHIGCRGNQPVLTRSGYLYHQMSHKHTWNCKWCHLHHHPRGGRGHITKHHRDKPATEVNAYLAEVKSTLAIIRSECVAEMKTKYLTLVEQLGYEFPITN